MECQLWLLVGLVLLMVYGAVSRTNTGGILYPQESESRDVRSLDGIWNFRLSPETDPLTGFRERWFQKDLSQVCLPIGNGEDGVSAVVEAAQCTQHYNNFYCMLLYTRIRQNKQF
jgi:hypothetical protein